LHIKIDELTEESDRVKILTEIIGTYKDVWEKAGLIWNVKP